MTIADWMILVAFLIPYVTAFFAKSRARKRFDNVDPRNLSKFDETETRIYNAHLNGFEVFPFFAVAVLFSEFRGVHQEVINAFALAFIGLRLLYTAAYVTNKDRLRSALFTIGMIVAIALFLLPFLR